jgi:hypothetical protein
MLLKFGLIALKTSFRTFVVVVVGLINKRVCVYVFISVCKYINIKV